jgi:hypothetical protein
MRLKDLELEYMFLGASVDWSLIRGIHFAITDSESPTISEHAQRHDLRGTFLAPASKNERIIKSSCDALQGIV